MALGGGGGGVVIHFTVGPMKLSRFWDVKTGTSWEFSRSITACGKSNSTPLRYKSSITMLLTSCKCHGCNEMMLMLKILKMPFSAFSSTVQKIKHDVSNKDRSPVYVSTKYPLVSIFKKCWSFCPTPTLGLRTLPG